VRALFAPAAGAEVGGGHLMRGLALAEALRRRGMESVFAVPPWGERLVRRFGEAAAARVHPLHRSGDTGEIATAADRVRPDLLVLDDYALGEEGEAALARPGLVLLAVDDLADRRHACEVMVDPGFGRSPQDYAGLVRPGCQVLTGPRYALLRSAFAGGAGRRDASRPVERVFVSFGLSDVGAIAERAVRGLRALAPEVVFDVALASDAPSLVGLQAMAQRDPRLHLHVDAHDVAALMRRADVAVGAGGASTWERCALGLPALVIVVAENQRAMIERLAASGAVLAADAADPHFASVLADRFDALRTEAARERLARTSRALCDGGGAERVAAAALARLSGAGTPGSSAGA
jgi:UDP-2,4-diacetamido-2,4,6-trideoxy-beta-L-altropyranose hydrolase